jgi:cell division protease FtsH
MRKTELNHRIATLLGGRAAEALIFNDISTGAQNDLSRATDIARSMVTQYGMSDRLGQVYFAHQQQPQFLAAMGETRGQYSDETAKTIDEEVKRIIDDQYQIALQILNDNRTLLAETAVKLLTDEVIDGDDLTVLAEAVKPAPEVSASTGTQSDPAEMAA